MKSFILQLYRGELCPGAVVPQSEEYKENETALEKGTEILEQKLKELMPELETRLKCIIDEYEVMCAIEREEMFCYGFSLGMKLLAEAIFLPDMQEDQ